MRKILLLGGSGLIGKQLPPMLVAAGYDVHVLLRHAFNDVSGATTHIAPSGGWHLMIDQIRPDVTISCLGTTRRKAGSNEAFAAIDRDLVLAVARAAKQAGTTQMIAVSSVGANAKSSNFYLCVKGEAEDGMRALDFDRLDVMRPGLLRGDRVEHRPGERVALMFAPLTDSLIPDSWSRYRSISAHQVALAVVAAIKQGGAGEFIHENDAIAALAG